MGHTAALPGAGRLPRFAAASANLVSVLRRLGLDAEAARELARQRMVEAAFDAGCVVEGEMPE